MLRGAIEYLPGYNRFFGSGDSSENDSLKGLIDFKKQKYDPANKEHCEYLQAKIKNCRKAYKNLYNKDMWNFVIPIGAPLLLLLATGVGYFGCLLLLAAAAYFAFYMIGGRFKEHQTLRARYHYQLQEMLDINTLLVEQSAVEIKLTKETSKEKGKNIQNAEKIEVEIEEHGERRKINAIVDNNYILQFGKKRLEVEIEEEGKKVRKKVIVDDEMILKLIQTVAPDADSRKLVMAYLINAMDQADISPAVLDIMSEPPHNMVFCSGRQQDENQLALVSPANSFKNLTRNYSAHTRFYFYGQGERELMSKVEKGIDMFTEIATAFAVNAMQKKGI